LPTTPHQKHPLAIPDRFPYRVIYEVVESERTVIVAAVLHAARHDREWQRRI
jgi:plasmid stabilization system protein ParE